MPSAAERLAQRHQLEVATIAGGVTSVVASAALGADPLAVSTWFWGAVDGLVARVQAGYAQARASGADYLRHHAGLSGATVRPFTGSLDTRALRARLEITGPVAFKTAIRAGHDTDYATRSMASQMSGVAGETVRDADRDVVHQTALHGGGVVGWRRVLVGRSCGFCAMLASRGAVYVSESSATAAKDGMAYHPHCNCAAMPLYRHEREPAEVRRLQRQWSRVTAGTSGKDAMRAWGRHWDKVEPRPPRSRAFEPVVQLRQSLASAQDTRAVSEAFRAEFRSITGRDVDARFAGSVATAREHAEGLLRTIERYPDTPLTRVQTGPLPFARYAESERGVVTFSEHWSSIEGRPRYLAALKADERRSWHPYSTPDGVASHEVVHVLDPDVPIDSLVGRRTLPGYSARSEHEAVAEAVADVVVNGGRASALSREIAAAVDDAYAAGRFAGRRPRLARPGPPARLSPPARRAAEAELNRLTVPQLKAMARARGVAVPSRMTKPQLVRLVDDLESGVPGPQALQRASAAVPAKAAKAAAKKAAPVKKAAAPKPAASMTPTALRKEIGDAGDGLPLADLPKADLAASVERLRAGATVAQERAALAEAVTRQRRIVADHLADVAKALDGGDVAKVRAALRRALADMPDGAAAKALRPVLTAMRTDNLATVRRAVAAAERKAGLRRTGGEVGVVVDGRVLRRQGLEVDIGGRTVVLREPEFTPATGRDLGLPSRDVPTLREIMDRGPATSRVSDEVREGIEGTFAGLRVQTSYAAASDSKITISGEIFDAQGRKVGVFSRTIRRYPNGEIVAEHEILKLDRKLQGSGFADAFNENLMDWYRRSGVTRVELHANIDVGGYAWARKGYDFRSPASARYFLDSAVYKIEKALRAYDRTGRLPRGITEAQLRELGHYIDELRRGVRPASAPEIARFGRQPGQGGKAATWPGKWLMLNSDWLGQLRL